MNVAPAATEFLLLPPDYRPAEEGNITWNLETDNIRYVNLHELVHSSLRTGDTQVGDNVSVKEPLPRYVRPLQRFKSAVRLHQSRTPIGLSEEFLNTSPLFFRQHATFSIMEGTQLRQAYATLLNYHTVSTETDLLTFVHAFLGEPVVDDPLDGYEQYNRPNWDGFDAEPITSETLRYARQIVEILPDVAQTVRSASTGPLTKDPYGHCASMSDRAISGAHTGSFEMAASITCHRGSSTTRCARI